MATQNQALDWLTAEGPAVETPSRTRLFSRKTLLAGVAVLLAVVGAAVWRITTKTEEPAFGMAAIRRTDITKTISATGKVQALTTVQVGTQVSGTISELHADFNQQVKKGDVIARLDPSQLQAQLTQAQASLLSAQASVATARSNVNTADASVAAAQASLQGAQSGLDDAKTTYELTKHLIEEQVTAKNELLPKEAALNQAAAGRQQALAQLNQAKAQAQSARSQLEQAKAQEQQARAQVEYASVNLQHTVITAPIDGIVVSRSVDIGQTVAASLQAPTLFVIANDLTQMQVLASVDEADVGQLVPDAEATFTVDAYPNDTFHGKILQVRLSPEAVQNVVTYTAVINVANPDLKLKPGMTANINAAIARRDDVLAVPNAALRFKPADAKTSRQKGPAVWKVEGGQLRAVPVKLGLTDGVVTEVVSGELKEGDKLATAVATNGNSKTATQTRSPFTPARPGGRR